RMVSSYTQLLMRRYGDKLDGDAKEFTAFIVDGATRMKQLIEDLLAYSRVGTRDKNFKPVDSESSLRRALTNLRAAIQDSGATVAASGCSPSPAPAPRFISPCRKRGKPRMDDATKGSRPVEILLVEDNPGDERLTREALKEGKVYSNLHWVKDGVEAMHFLRREGRFANAIRPDIILLDLNLPKMVARQVL